MRSYSCSHWKISKKEQALIIIIDFWSEGLGLQDSDGLIPGQKFEFYNQFFFSSAYTYQFMLLPLKSS